MMLTAFFLSVSYRLRGWGGFLHGTFERRMFWVCSVMIACLLNGSVVGSTLLAGVGAYLGLLIPHGKWFDVSTLEKSFILSAIYFCRIVLICLPFGFHPVYFAYFSIIITAGYWLGHKALHETGIDALLIAELIAGFCIGACFIRVTT